MCGRTSLFAPVEDLVERFDATPDYEYRPRYNVSPGTPLATIDAEAPDTISQREWGLVAPWADDPDDGPRPINARAETVAEKRFFADAFAERRCLVLVDGYYEWRETRGGKQPYRIHRPGDAPFALAGLWRRWEPADDAGVGEDAVTGGDAATGDAATGDAALDTVTVITCDAAPPIADIHDRMPVMLPRAGEERWLQGTPDQAADLLGPYDGDDLEAYPVRRTVNDPSNDSPAVLQRSDEPEQTGLDSFGA